MPSFTPKSDEELYGIIPEGVECNLVIMSAEETTSKSGNEMISLQMSVTPKGQRNSFLYKEYLVFSDSQAWKIKSICKSFGLLQQYNTGYIDANHFKGAKGVAVFEHQKDEKGYTYARAKKYISDDGVGSQQKHQVSGSNPPSIELQDPPFDDDIKF